MLVEYNKQKYNNVYFQEDDKKKFVNCVFVTDDDLSPEVELNKSCAAKKWLK